MVRGHKRSPKQLWLSFDEWNVWYRERSGDAVTGRGQAAPHLLEEKYNLEDALLVGAIVNTLLRNAKRIKIACLAQLVNVIAPIFTNPKGLFKQTIFHPYSWGLQFARGKVLDLYVESPTYDVTDIGEVPYIDAAGTMKPDDQSVSLFLLNRDLSKSQIVEVTWQDHAPARVLNALVLTGDDLKASNSFESPQRVAPRPMEKPSSNAGQTRFELPPRSYAVVQWTA
jgi:alpha-N-arabinofuranosidase